MLANVPQPVRLKTIRPAPPIRQLVLNVLSMPDATSLVSVSVKKTGTGSPTAQFTQENAILCALDAMDQLRLIAMSATITPSLMEKVLVFAQQTMVALAVSSTLANVI
jgi:hypothetical protein